MTWSGDISKYSSLNVQKRSHWDEESISGCETARWPAANHRRNKNPMYTAHIFGVFQQYHGWNSAVLILWAAHKAGGATATINLSFKWMGPGERCVQLQHFIPQASIIHPLVEIKLSIWFCVVVKHYYVHSIRCIFPRWFWKAVSIVTAPMPKKSNGKTTTLCQARYGTGLMEKAPLQYLSASRVTSIPPVLLRHCLNRASSPGATLELLQGHFEPPTTS